LTLGPEFVYLRDNFGQRLNTVFKFYYQAWVMFGIAAIVTLNYLRARTNILGAVAIAGYGMMFALALLFPILAVQSRAREYAGEPTLDGMAQMALFNPDELAAINWLRQNASPEEVILEATGGQYSNYGRVSAHTGNPTVLGWLGHEQQWRGFSFPEPARRSPLVTDLYATNDWQRTVALLNEFDVAYVYVGNLEARDAGQAVFEKFEQNLELAYSNDSVRIYRWTGDQFQ
jgi:uncharacterized membrane protein